MHTPCQRFSQCTTSFIGTRRQGIPRVPLLSFRTCDPEKLMLLRSSLLAYSFVKLQPGSYPPVSRAEFSPRSHSLTCNCSSLNLHLATVRHFYRQKQPGISPGLLSTHTSRNAVEPFSLSRFGCSHHVRVCQKQLSLSRCRLFGLFTVCLLYCRPSALSTLRYRSSLWR